LRAGRAEGALQAARGLIAAWIENLVRNSAAQIVCYCADGHCAVLAAGCLQRLGHRNIRAPSGGFAGWERTGVPIASRTAWD